MDTKLVEISAQLTKMKYIRERTADAHDIDFHICLTVNKLV